MARELDDKGDPIWPGAVEAGLQKYAKYPEVIDLTTPEQQTWMNQVVAEREKGAPLSGPELRRILRGEHWKREPRLSKRSK